MANNVYGIVKPSLLDVSKDVDIYYHYRPSRTSEDPSFRDFKKIDNPETILKLSRTESAYTTDLRLPGMYNLNLPVDKFGAAGVYTIYIVPREIYCTIMDVGTLAAYPDIRGVVINTSALSNTDIGFFRNDNLVGYKIDYFSYSGSGLMRQDYYRIITSSNLCEPVTQNLTSGYSNSNGYRFNESGTLCFLTVTPSTSPGFRANSAPYIGVPSQTIAISNTKFDPVCIEVSIVRHDIETLSIMAEGDQIRNLENGRVTTYNENGEIYRQWEYFTTKDTYTGSSIAEAKIGTMGNIDTSLNIDDFKD